MFLEFISIDIVGVSEGSKWRLRGIPISGKTYRNNTPRRRDNDDLSLPSIERASEAISCEYDIGSWRQSTHAHQSHQEV